MPQKQLFTRLVLLFVLIIGFVSAGVRAETIEQAIDTNGNGIIDDAEIIIAVHYWITGQPVPGTGGQIIDDQEILKLVALWTTGSPISGNKIVTLDDNGQTIQLHVGERFLLKLGSNYNWIVSIADPTIVSRVPNVLVVQGAQGLYEAKRPGRTTLTAVGDLPCRQAQPPCEAPSRLFQVQLIVQ